jgi:hypothetical protein
MESYMAGPVPFLIQYGEIDNRTHYGIPEKGHASLLLLPVRKKNVVP